MGAAYPVVGFAVGREPVVDMDAHIAEGIARLKMSPCMAEVARLLVLGAALKEIAPALGMSESTVNAWRKVIYVRYACHTRVQLLRVILGLPPVVRLG